MLTHGNLLSNIEGCAKLFDIGTDDTCLSFLPLSHVFERVDGYYFMLHKGAVIAYAESIDTVPSDLEAVKPTIVISVPRLFEKMFARVMERVTSGPWIRRKIFFGALAIGRRHADNVVAKAEDGVITSYSIHYTKLYDDHRRQGALRKLLPLRRLAHQRQGAGAQPDGGDRAPRRARFHARGTARCAR